MGRLSGIRRALHAKPNPNDLLVGVVCMTLGVVALSLSWFAFRGGNEPPRQYIGIGVSSDAGLVGEIVPDPDGLPPAPLPLHRRADYQVEPPDVLTIRATDASDARADEEMLAVNGERLVEGDGNIELGPLGSLHVEGLTPHEIEAAIERRAAAQDRNWQVDVSVFAQNSKVYFLIFEGNAESSVHRHSVAGGETVSEALADVCEPSGTRVFVARAKPGDTAAAVLPVEWDSGSGQIARKTNYKIQPGDRIFVEQLAWWEQLLNRMAAMVRDQATDLSDRSAAKPAETHSR